VPFPQLFMFARDSTPTTDRRIIVLADRGLVNFKLFLVQFRIIIEMFAVFVKIEVFAQLWRTQSVVSAMQGLTRFISSAMDMSLPSASLPFVAVGVNAHDMGTSTPHGRAAISRRLVFFCAICLALLGTGACKSRSKDLSEVVTQRATVQDLEIVVTAEREKERDKAGFDALKQLHRQMDDDQSGSIDRHESVGVRVSVFANHLRNLRH
jgi:hypothetical protein